MRFLSAFRYDVIFQIRHGFYAAYGILTLMYIIILLNLPTLTREGATVLLIFSDISVLGYFFIGGIILLERRQGTLNTLTVTPLRPWEYLWAKVLSLTCISVVVGVVILLTTSGLQPEILWFLPGLTLSAVLFTLLGLVVAIRSETVNEYFFRGLAYYMVFMVPLIHYFGVVEHPLFHLLPTLGMLHLLESAFWPHSPGELWLALGTLALWSVLAWIWVKHWFRKYIILRKGGVS